MDMTQTLAYVVIAAQVLLVLAALYFYSSYRLRLFLFLGLGFFVLLSTSIIQVILLPGVDVGIYSNLLGLGACMFFLTGVLTAV